MKPLLIVLLIWNLFNFSLELPLDNGEESEHEDVKSPPGTCNCGIKNDELRIVGGEDAIVSEFPWRVNVRRKDGGFCGGTIISKDWVMTAAHCIYRHEDEPSNIAVDVGNYDLSRKDEVINSIHRVELVTRLEEYNRINQDNDIALLKLETPIQYSRNVAPICLPWNYKEADFKNETIVASGWGTLKEGGAISYILQKVEMPVLTTEECKEYYPKFITDNMICTYNEGKDTCQGDSGGSIDWKDVSGRYFAIGVVSWGHGCGRKDKPGVYTKVTHYTDWIQKVTGDDSFCKD